MAEENRVKLPREIGPVTMGPVSSGFSETGSAKDTGPDAEQIVKALLQSVGLGDLADVIWQAVGETKISSATSVDQIGFMIRDTEPYKKRFAGNIARRNANLAEYSITEYLDLEKAYRNAIQGSGLPAGFYDSPEYYSQFIGGNVSPAEVKRRVDEGYRAIKNADPQVLAQLKQYYPSVGNGELAAFFLDPTVTTDIIVNRARAAEIGAQATLQAGMGISESQAEYLRQQGVTQEGAQQAFGSIAMQRGLYEPQMAGEQAVDVQTQIEAATGVRAEAVQRVETRRRKRKAEFEAGGAFAAGQTGVAGLGTANR